MLLPSMPVTRTDLACELATYRLMLSIALAQAQASLARQATLEAQLAALREEIRRYTRAKVDA